MKTFFTVLAMVLATLAVVALIFIAIALAPFIYNDHFSHLAPLNKRISVGDSCEEAVPLMRAHIEQHRSHSGFEDCRDDIEIVGSEVSGTEWNGIIAVAENSPFGTMHIVVKCRNGRVAEKRFKAD